MSDLRNEILEAALNHVVFDGWSEATLLAAASDAGADESQAREFFPRPGLDLALAFHRRADAAMREKLVGEDLSEMRIRERICHAVKLRLEDVAEHKEAVQRGVSLFALPLHAAEGSRAIWETADAIWDALGDSSDDYNWYSKRLTLSGVYSATVLYWLGDSSEGHEATWAFLERRIEDVMRIEKLKAHVNDSKLLAPFMAGPNWLLSQIKPPKSGSMADMPGSWGRNS